MKKDFYRHLLRFLIAIIRSNVFIPISEYTKKQFHKSFPFLTSRVSHVVYNGTSCKLVSEMTVEKTLRKFGLNRKPFFLAFAAPGPRKGLDLTLSAYALYRSNGGKASLVLIVAGQWQNILRQMVFEKGLESVSIVSEIETYERDALYRRAVALLFPSRCEGFGYPVLEAMCQGCPPIAWREGPALEIVSSSSPLVDKLDVAEIVDHMLAFEGLADDGRSELAERLMGRSQLFRADQFGHNFLRHMRALNDSRDSSTGFVAETPPE